MHKKNLHILHDDKFTDGAIAQFEKYYPDQNRYIILQSGHGPLSYTKSSKNTVVLNLRDRKLFAKLVHLVTEERCKNLFIHYLDTYKAALIRSLLRKFELKFYWIFYGGDLYGYLEEQRGYQIYDSATIRPKNPLTAKAVKTMKYLSWFGVTPNQALKWCYDRCDYFCFWNEYDFELYQQYFPNKAKYKPFIYYHALGNSQYVENPKKEYVMVNHSASFSGNHLHVLDLLQEKQLVDSPYHVLLPLSYGDTVYADHVAEEYQKVYGAKAEVLRDFMPMDMYQHKLGQVSTAIFGMRRQEAAGNIFQLLNLGSRIFLREDNSLLKWLLKRDFIVFNLDDLNAVGDLRSLEIHEVLQNRTQYQSFFNDDIFAQMMEDLIEK